jgi:hypothetical protein
MFALSLWWTSPQEAKLSAKSGAESLNLMILPVDSALHDIHDAKSCYVHAESLNPYSRLLVLMTEPMLANIELYNE